MDRDLARLTDSEHELLIVGSGIFGACAAWDAILRGLSVALVEKEDFGYGASANSFKMVHGGIRYIQHGDIPRIRSSCRERTALLRIAPHLVEPLPIAIPTFGHGRQGKAFLGTGMCLYDLLTLDRNRQIKDPQRRVPYTTFLTKDTLLKEFPGLEGDRLTGAAIFSDAQMYNPTRLVLAFVQSAAEEGAAVANYVDATDFLVEGDCVKGVAATDRLTGSRFSVRAKAVLNAAGPWAEPMLAKTLGIHLAPRGIYSRDACFVVPRRFDSRFALALQGQTKDPDAIVSRSARHLFLVPWRDYTLVGVWHVVYEKSPDLVNVGSEELETFIREMNWTYPALELSLPEVRMWNAGLVPFGDNEADAVNLSYGKRSRLVDHKREHNLDGLVTLIGVRYTMGRGDAAQAIDLICKKLNRQGKRPRTTELPIWGGDFDNFEDLVATVGRALGREAGEKAIRSLAHNYGTRYRRVLEIAQRERSMQGTLGTSTVLRAEVPNAVRNEMACHLTDVVFRRTDLATGGDPGEETLRACAKLMAQELDWSAARVEAELDKVRAGLPNLADTHAIRGDAVGS